MAKFSIHVPCKPYAKHFLELNYGSPVDFSKDKTLYNEFRHNLERNMKHNDNYYNKLKMSKYSETVEIRISETDFYRYGWELSKTEMLNFNAIVESRAKTFMYIIVSTRLALGQNLTDCISYFQDRFGFTEEVWPLESIKKDCQRNLTVSKNEILDSISEMIDKITMAKLYDKRTISHKCKKIYETA